MRESIGARAPAARWRADALPIGRHHMKADTRDRRELLREKRKQRASAENDSQALSARCGRFLFYKFDERCRYHFILVRFFLLRPFGTRRETATICLFHILSFRSDTARIAHLDRQFIVHFHLSRE